MSNLYAILGDSPEQVVTRALAACPCSEPEGHPALAPLLLERVVPNGGDQSMGAFALIMPVPGTLDDSVEGVMLLTSGVTVPMGQA